MDNSHQVLKMRFNSNVPSSGEFTRRKNWSQSILESVRDVIHVLNNDLRIVYCSAASSEFLGYKPSELVQHVYTEFIHVDDIDMFVRDFRNTKATLQTLRTTYRFLRKDGKYTTLETRGRFYKDSFFGNARRIPTEAANSIDSFLDLKMENEMLKRKLELLKNEQKNKETSLDSEQNNTPNPGNMSNVAGDDTNSSEEYEDYTVLANGANVYTQGVTSNYDISESLSLFTGLRYDLGERSVGISLGLQEGELTMIGMDQIMSHPIIVSNNENLAQATQVYEPRLEKKKRANPSEDPKFCTDCGTSEAPEWRRGPNGPKTLCNACGLRWSKNKKKLENQTKATNQV